MSISEYLKDYSNRADDFLKAFFSRKSKEGSNIDLEIGRILSDIEVYSRGGKKLRGALTQLGYQIAGGKDKKAILPVTCGIELIHNFLLIHDDIIDQDNVRRGKPTLHIKYSKAKDKHFGISKAIIVGDLASNLAQELILASKFSGRKLNKALLVLNDMVQKTVYGELLDIEFDHKQKVLWEDIMKVRTYKTAYYTFVMPLTVGAILGGARDSKIKAIEKFGIPVGIAFQLMDDILGVFGDLKKTGKSNDSDITDGKKTFLFVKALELAPVKGKKYLLKWYGSKLLNSKRINNVRQIIKESGSLEFSKNLGEKFANKGKVYIPAMTRDRGFQELLFGFADLVVSRDK